MKKKAHSWLLFALIFVVALSGCSGGQSASSGDDASAEKETKTIHFMHLWPKGSAKQHHMIVNDIIAKFESNHPNVKVKLEVLSNEQYKNKLKVLGASNQLPDVGMTWGGGFIEPYVSGDLFAPVDDVLESGLNELFVPGTTDAYAVDGKTYALPLELNIVPIYYNKKIFAKYGIEIPKTYAEFKNVVKTLVDHGVTPITVGNKEPWTGSMWYMYFVDRIGGSNALTNAIQGSGSFADPAFVRAAEEIQNLVKMDAFIRGYNGLSNNEAKAAFMNGNAAMYMMGTWELPNYTTNESVPKEFRESVGYFKFPIVEGGKGSRDSWVGGPGVALFVAQNSEVKDVAKEFVKFFVKEWGDQAVTKAGVIPATKVDTSGKDLPQMYIDILNELNNASNITLYADVQMSPDVAQVHLESIQALYGLQITPEQFVQHHVTAMSQE